MASRSESRSSDKKIGSRSRSRERQRRRRGGLSRTRSPSRRNDKRSRSRSSSRRHHAASRSRSPSRGKAGDQDKVKYRRSSSSESARKQRKKEKKHEKHKKKHKRHKTEEDDATGSTLAQQDDIFSESERRQALTAESPPSSALRKDPAVSLTASNNVMSFFAQLKQQEASKGPVGTLHASGVKAPVPTGVVEGWECAKPGCGHRNSKYAGSCNKCGAMKRMSEWR